jgi:hypothetical protein
MHRKLLLCLALDPGLRRDTAVHRRRCYVPFNGLTARYLAEAYAAGVDRLEPERLPVQ